jgi:hypothetical protein
MIVVNITEKGMAEIKEELVKRKNALDSLTAKPFSLNNSDHLAKLKQYNDNFEFELNQILFFDALSSGVPISAFSWFLGKILPIPDFLDPILKFFFLFGVSGLVLKHFDTTNFFLQLQEMKTIYSWCLKNGNEKYDASIDNSECLACPEIQRMIKLMAPVCSAEDIIVWKRETDEPQESSSWISSGIKLVGSLTSPLFFGANPTVNPDAAKRIRELKIAIENGTYNHPGTLEKLQQSIAYFTTNPEFRSYLRSKAASPETLKVFVPETVRAFF